MRMWKAAPHLQETTTSRTHLMRLVRKCRLRFLPSASVSFPRGLGLVSPPSHLCLRNLGCGELGRGQYSNRSTKDRTGVRSSSTHHFLAVSPLASHSMAHASVSSPGKWEHEQHLPLKVIMRMKWEHSCHQAWLSARGTESSQYRSHGLLLYDQDTHFHFAPSFRWSPELPNLRPPVPWVNAKFSEELKIPLEAPQSLAQNDTSS